MAIARQPLFIARSIVRPADLAPPPSHQSLRASLQCVHESKSLGQYAQHAFAVSFSFCAMRAARKRRSGSHRHFCSLTTKATSFAAADGSGAVLEVVGGPAELEPQDVTLLLIHGSYHAAWCWKPYFVPFFQGKGYGTYALSLRGQGEGIVPGEAPQVAGTLEMHAADVSAFVEYLFKQDGKPVVLLGHSFGGLIVQRAVADLALAGSCAVKGMVLMSSVPPTGNGPLVWRYLFRSPWLAARITYGFISRAFENDEELCRELFFGPLLPSADLVKYMGLMRESSPPGTRLLDLRELQRSLPLPEPKQGAPSTLVLGGACDAIVDVQALEESADFYGTTAVVLDELAHDSMLDVGWERSAEAVLNWVHGLKNHLN